MTEITYEKAERFLDLDFETKRLAKEIKPLKEELKNYTQQFGEKDADKGHLKVILTKRGKDKIVLQNTCKISANLRPAALDVIKEHFPKEVQKKLIEKIEVVRTDILEEMLQSGELSDKLVEQLYTTDTVYAFSAKKL